MDLYRILVFSENQAILDTTLALFHLEKEYAVDGVLDEEEGIQLFQRNRYDLVVLAGFISQMSVKKLKAVIGFQDPDIPFLSYFGGDPGTFLKSIQSLSSPDESQKFQLKDNPFGP